MEAVSLAMQYQRAEIKQLRQSVRPAQHPYELSDIARLTPYELAALEGDTPPLLLEDGAEEKKRKEEDKTGEIRERRKFLLPPSAFLLAKPSADLFAQTINAQTTFVSPATEYDIAFPEEEDSEEAELPAAASNPAEAQEEAPE